MKRMEKWSSVLVLTLANASGHYDHAGVEFTLLGFIALGLGQQQFNTPTESKRKSRSTLIFVLNNYELNITCSLTRAHYSSCTLLRSVLWVRAALVGLAVCLSAGPCLLLMAAVFLALFVFFSTVSLAVQTTLKRPTLITLHFLCCTHKTDDYPNL